MWQQLIIKYGGTLCQHIYNHAYSNEFRGDKVHDLIFEPEYKMLEAQLIARRKKKNIATCSLHHQGAYNDKENGFDIPESLKVICKTDDGIVEAIEHNELPIAGCQFHTKTLVPSIEI